MSSGDDATKKDTDISFQTEIMPARRDLLEGPFKALFDYWDKLRGAAFAPPWQQFDWGSAPKFLVPHCAVVEVRRQPLDFVYVYWGLGRTIMQGADYTGKSVQSFKPQRIADKAFQEYSAVLERKTALYIRTKRMVYEDAAPFDYQFLRLPFSDDGTRVNHILGVGMYDNAIMARALDFYEKNPTVGNDLDSLVQQLERENEG